MNGIGRFLAIAGVAGLSACGGGGDDDDGGGVLNPPAETFGSLRNDFDDLFARQGDALVTPQAAMPASGSATYDGNAVFSNVETDPNLIIADPTSVSKVTLTADFADGGIGGRLYDFRAANDATMDGELAVDGTISENSFVAGIDGALVIDGTVADHSGGVMLGAFLGDDAGAVGGPIAQGTSPTPYNGSFIAER